MNEFFILPIEKLKAYAWGIRQVIERHAPNQVTNHTINDMTEEIKGVCLACGFPDWFKHDITFYRDKLYLTSANRQTVEACKVIAKRLMFESAETWSDLFDDLEEN